MERRQFIATSAVAAVSVAIPASAAAEPAADRSAWDAAMSALDKIKAEDEAFTPGWSEAWQRCKADCDAIPHVTFPPETYTGGRCQTTADALAVKQARCDVELLDAGKMHLDPLPGLREHYAIKRELVEAADARDRQIRAVRDRYDMDARDDRAEELGDMLADAAEALMGLPAPDLAALRWKLDYLTDSGEQWDGWSGDYTRQTLADIAQLLPPAA